MLCVGAKLEISNRSAGTWYQEPAACDRTLPSLTLSVNKVTRSFLHMAIEASRGQWWASAAA